MSRQFISVIKAESNQTSEKQQQPQKQKTARKSHKISESHKNAGRIFIQISQLTRTVVNL